MPASRKSTHGFWVDVSPPRLRDFVPGARVD